MSKKEIKKIDIKNISIKIKRGKIIASFLQKIVDKAEDPQAMLGAGCISGISDHEANLLLQSSLHNGEK